MKLIKVDESLGIIIAYGHGLLLKEVPLPPTLTTKKEKKREWQKRERA